MTAETVALGAVGALQAMALFILKDLRTRIGRLEGKAMEIDESGCKRWGPVCASWETAIKRMTGTNG